MDVAEAFDTVFLSTPSARRATGAAVVRGCPDGISIHALREEGDLVALRNLQALQLFLSTPSARRATEAIRDTCGEDVISIHALREEGDRENNRPPTAHSYFYPRPPRGGRLYFTLRDGAIPSISIHALREEGDYSPVAGKRPSENFYPRPPRGGRPRAGAHDRRNNIFLSTPSARRATEWADKHRRLSPISIHALREEGDLGSAT